MKLTFTLILSIVIMFNTCRSLRLFEVLRQLPTSSTPLYCMIESSTDLYHLQEAFRDNSEQIQQQVVISSDNFILRGKKCSHYLTAVDDRSWGTAEKLFVRLFHHRCWNNRGYFVFLSESGFNMESLRFYGTIMKCLGITNSAIIFREFELYGYDYFSETFLHFETMAIMLAYLRSDHLRNLRGYVFQIIISNAVPLIVISYNPFKVEGSVALLLESFANHLNGSINWHAEHGHLLAKDLLHIMGNNTDIVPNRYFASPLIEPVYETQYDSIVLLISEKLRSSFFNQLMVPYSVAVWIVILVLCVSCSLLNISLKKFLPHNILLMLFFGTARAEHRLARVERFVVAAMSILLFILSEAYLAKMLSYIMNVLNEAHLQNLQDFDRTTMSLCINFIKIPVSYTKFLESISPGLSQRLAYRNSTKNWFDFEDCSWLLTSQDAEQFLNSRNNYEPTRLRRKLYMLPQTLAWHPRAHAFSRRGPFVGRFTTIKQWLTEAGIIKQWMELTKLRYVQRKWNVLAILEFDDLLSLWYILGYGFAISAVVFLVEVIFKKIVTFFKLMQRPTKVVPAKARNISTKSHIF